jgi:SAM-dependent methyltransferase
MSSPWFVEAFRAGYLSVYAHRDEASAAAEVEFAASALGGARRVLDAGCGAGRHARALAGRGLDVTGVDLSLDLLRSAFSAGGGPRYVRGDLRALPFRDGAFDAVVSFFTSFGYFDDAGNARHASGLRRVTRKGGVLVLDFLNAAHVRATLVPRSEKERDGTRIVEERAVRGGRVEKDVTLTSPSGETRSWRESVRLYDRDELEDVVTTAGFRVRSVHGDLQGAPHGPRTPRCVVVAEAA